MNRTYMATACLAFIMSSGEDTLDSYQNQIKGNYLYCKGGGGGKGNSREQQELTTESGSGMKGRSLS